MKEPGWVSVRVVAECSVLLARRKREESRDQGLLQGWAEKHPWGSYLGTASEGQELYSHLLFKALSPGQTAALTSLPALIFVTGAGWGVAICADGFLWHLGKVFPLASTLTEMGWYFSMCFTGQKHSWMPRRVKFWFLVLPFKRVSWLFGKTTGSMGTGDASSLNRSKWLRKVLLYLERVGLLQELHYEWGTGQRKDKIRCYCEY